MLLDLNKLHGSREHVERSVPPSAFDPQDPEYRVAAPVQLAMDVEKAGGDAFRVSLDRCVGEVEDAFEFVFGQRGD